MPAWGGRPTSTSRDAATIQVPMPDGGTIKVRSVDGDFDPRDKAAALELLRESDAEARSS